MPWFFARHGCLNEHQPMDPPFHGPVAGEVVLLLASPKAGVQGEIGVGNDLRDPPDLLGHFPLGRRCLRIDLAGRDASAVSWAFWDLRCYRVHGCDGAQHQ